MKQDDEVVGKRAQLEVVHAYISHLKVPTALKDEIEAFFHARLQKASLSSIRDEHVYGGLPIALQIEVSTVINRSLVAGASVLRGCSDGFLDRLSAMLVEVRIEPETIVFRTNEACRELFIIQTGAVDVYEEPEQEGATTDFSLKTEMYKALLKAFPEQEDIVMDNAMRQYEGALCALACRAAPAELPPLRLAACSGTCNTDIQYNTDRSSPSNSRSYPSHLLPSLPSASSPRCSARAGMLTARSGRSKTSGTGTSASCGSRSNGCSTGTPSATYSSKLSSSSFDTRSVDSGAAASGVTDMNQIRKVRTMHSQYPLRSLLAPRAPLRLPAFWSAKHRAPRAPLRLAACGQPNTRVPRAPLQLPAIRSAKHARGDHDLELTRRPARPPTPLPLAHLPFLHALHPIRRSSPTPSASARICTWSSSAPRASRATSRSFAASSRPREPT
jgi:hypothetical protein